MTVPLHRILNGNSYRTYNIHVAHHFGSVKAAIMLSDLLDRHDMHESNNELEDIPGHGLGWFYYTVDKCYERTCLTKKEQLGALNVLQKHGLVEKKQWGMPAVRYIKINIESLFTILDSSNNFYRSDKREQQGVTKGNNKVCQKGTTAPIYKNTTKNPKEETQEEPPSAGVSLRAKRERGSVPKKKGKCLTVHEAVKYKNLDEAQSDTLMWLVSLKLGSNVETLAEWAKTQQRANLEAMHTKAKDKDKPGAYMMHLIKTNVQLATEHSNQNKETATLFQKIYGKTRLIIKELYAIILNENGAEKEAYYSIASETFVDMLEQNLGQITG